MTRRIRFRPGQRFFLNVNGKIEQYKFVQARYMYDGNVAIIAVPRHLPNLKMTLLAQRGFVRRDFRKVEKGGTYDKCCMFSCFDRMTDLSVWCGIYFSRRAAKKGICTYRLWEQKYQELLADPMSDYERELGVLSGAMEVLIGKAVSADLIDANGNVRKMQIRPSPTMKDILNGVCTATHLENKLRETTKSVIQGTAADIMTATINAPREYRFSKQDPIETPLPRRMFDWPASIVVRQGDYPIIKGGV